MPPDWKTFDEATADALKDRAENSGVSVGALTKPLFADGDAVVVAPTLQKGAALVITARKKATAAPAEEPVHYSPLVEEIAEPTVPNTSPAVIHAVPEANDEELETTVPPTTTVYQEPEPTFGPTTWERAEEVETPTEFAEPQHEARSIDPEVWDLPSEAPPQEPPEVLPEESQRPNSDWAEERFVATGFLGLEDYVEDEEEILKSKRPWWKRIFSD